MQETQSRQIWAEGSSVETEDHLQTSRDLHQKDTEAPRRECSLLYLHSFLWPAEGDLWSYKKKAV